MKWWERVLAKLCQWPVSEALLLYDPPDPKVAAMVDKLFDLKTPQVWNARRLNEIPDNAVLVDRTTKWGNRVAYLRHEGERSEIIKKYEEWLMTQPELIKEMRTELKGKHLVCWCAPLACHADVILRVANEKP